MQDILAGVLAGLVAAAVLGALIYRVLSKTIDDKLRTYMEALLRYQQSLGNNQIQQIAGLTGKMDSVYTGMDKLEKSLMNVKTRGIYGEWQLGALIQQILTPDQYETECMVVPGSRSA